MTRRSLTSFVTISALALPLVAGAHPLEDAAREAVALCVGLGALSTDHCGTEMSGRSPEHTAARRAVGRAYTERNAFMRACQKERSFRVCVDQADWYMGAGMSRVLNTPVVHLK